MGLLTLCFIYTYFHWTEVCLQWKYNPLICPWLKFKHPGNQLCLRSGRRFFPLILENYVLNWPALFSSNAHQHHWFIYVDSVSIYGCFGINEKKKLQKLKESEWYKGEWETFLVWSWSHGFILNEHWALLNMVLTDYRDLTIPWPSPDITQGIRVYPLTFLK